MEALIVKMIASINMLTEVIKQVVPMTKNGKIIASFVCGAIVSIYFHLQGAIESIQAALILGIYCSAMASGVYEILHNILKDWLAWLKSQVK